MNATSFAKTLYMSLSGFMDNRPDALMVLVGSTTSFLWSTVLRHVNFILDNDRPDTRPSHVQMVLWRKLLQLSTDELVALRARVLKSITKLRKDAIDRIFDNPKVRETFSWDDFVPQITRQFGEDGLMVLEEVLLVDSILRDRKRSTISSEMRANLGSNQLTDLRSKQRSNDALSVEDQKQELIRICCTQHLFF